MENKSKMRCKNCGSKMLQESVVNNKRICLWCGVSNEVNYEGLELVEFQDINKLMEKL
jgi:transcription initiation factor TFIIIB Brf1 subunit/transcription initiation factor TFIIB